MKRVVVVQGQCFSSIAFEHGFFWRSLWELGDNAGLKATRASPFVLKPGDVVCVPELRQKSASCAVDARHRFRRKGIPETLNLRFVEGDAPRANIPYRLTLDGVTFEGRTDADGWLRHAVSPTLKVGTLVFDTREGGANETYDLSPRALDPVDDVSGQQARLKHLNYYAGAVDGSRSDETIVALRDFQRDHDLPDTGEADAATRDALVAAHGC